MSCWANYVRKKASAEHVRSQADNRDGHRAGMGLRGAASGAQKARGMWGAGCGSGGVGEAPGWDQPALLSTPHTARPRGSMPSGLGQRPPKGLGTGRASVAAAAQHGAREELSDGRARC